MGVEGGYIVFSTQWQNYLPNHPAIAVARWGKIAARKCELRVAVTLIPTAVVCTVI